MIVNKSKYAIIIPEEKTMNISITAIPVENRAHCVLTPPPPPLPHSHPEEILSSCSLCVPHP